MIVMNRTLETKQIKIVLADGSRDSIQLLPRGRKPVELPAGAQIDPDMIAEYLPILKTQPPLSLPSTPVSGDDE